MGNVVVGTCSWTDKTMVERWYPQGVSSAEQRLRYYAARFDTVEVDSSFYAIPRRDYAEAWVRRTPPGFIFHVKAYGMLTGHEVDERALPPELRDEGFDYAVTPYGRVRHPEPRMVEEAYRLFLDAIEPLRDGARMGGVLMQYPPWFTARTRDERETNLGRIGYAAEQLAPLPVFVEFRHGSWFEPRNFERVERFLGQRGLSLVAVDAPQVGGESAVPPVAVATSPLGYVRFHGRNTATWTARTTSAADRFDYLYETDELREWAAPIRRLAEQTERTWVMFNNCKYDYAPRNARELAEILGGELMAPRLESASDAEPEVSDGAVPADGGPDVGEQLDLGL